ncbi:MAG: Smr/MutS family protein [Deltaproteobacteria bacterium]|jgi:DNA mismatch repair protein MutS2|nr:Smr/MutS family protein [Deltaproteobacteria bacterium]
MNDSTLELLEFDAVLQWLAEEAHSEPAAEAALALRPELSPEEVDRAWARLAEARRILSHSESPDFRDHWDLSPLLAALAPEGARLAPEELLLVGRETRASRQAAAFFRPWATEVPRLAALAADLDDFPGLTETIERSLGPEGEVLDAASPQLAKLRLELSGARAALTAKLGELMRSEEFRPALMDELVTTRNDRFVVPVRASAAGRRRGLVHDWSNSGATAYLEPLETVEDNNRLALIKREEKREIERILARLSEMCRQAADKLRPAGAALTALDLLFAQARLAQAFGAAEPERLPAGGGVQLLNARHPILDRRLKAEGRAMIPLNLIVETRRPMVVVSGVNTGGKTVALKTLGLALALAKAGLPVPAGDGSRLELPHDVLAVIGDGQDLSADLSTFSGHVRAVGEILRAARPGTMILVDELGSGTDPAEGAALGLAVLERLRASGALVMAATHFHLIKSWAALAEGVVSAAAASSSEGQPVYGLLYGSPGFSGGLRMARRLGLPADLVDRAESWLDDGQRQALELLRKLDEERGALQREKNLLAETRRRLESEALERREAAKRESEAINRQAQEQQAEIRAALIRHRREFEQIKDDLKRERAAGRVANVMAAGVAKARLDKELLASRPAPINFEPEPPLTRADVGQPVRLRRLGREGLVTACQPDKDEYWVETGTLTVKARLEELCQTRGGLGPEVVSVTVSPAVDGALSLNLLGRTVDEAEVAIDREIDQAILGGRSRLTIIHGLGTGRLKRGVVSHLKKHPRVKNFFSPAQRLGGAGVTEVELN